MSSNMERKVSDLSSKLAKINAETAAEKVKSSKALQGLRSEYDQLQKLYDALRKESDGTKDGIETYKRQCNAAQEEAKLHQATALEVNDDSSNEMRWPYRFIPHIYVGFPLYIHAIKRYYSPNRYRRPPN